ncbi:MAG: hypothetical protein FJX47_18695 [Alphaproteobacteria bacterium]|nr:hypothetical protein [Alphaproteobacteria bacterium]
MSTLVETWLASGAVILAVLVGLRLLRKDDGGKPHRLNLLSLIVLAAILGAIPAFVRDYLSVRSVDLPPEMKSRPSIGDRPG